MSNMNRAVQNVIDLHSLIENVFTGKNQDSALRDLLGSFDNDFKMVSTNGLHVGLDQVKELFSSNVGAKPSLKITPHNIKPILESDNHCWIQYQELHETPESKFLRTSTVCVRVEDTRCYWLYLHETVVTK